MDSAPKASGTDSTRTATTNGNGRRGVIELARIAVEDTVRLVQQEIELAKVELKEMLQSNLRAAIFLALAGLFALLFLVMLFVTIALLFGSPALAAGIETAIFLVLTVILGLVGKSMLKIGAPPKTMTTLKEDAEWARQVLTRNGK